MYKIKVPIGDWSGDGHSQCQEYMIISSHPASELRKAYYESELKTGLTFRHKYNDNPAHIKPICTDYEENFIDEEQIEGLLEAGFNFNLIDLYEDECPVLGENLPYDFIYLDESNIFKMLMWFIGLGLDGFEYEIANDEFESLSEYGAGNFCHQFGYGVFY